MLDQTKLVIKVGIIKQKATDKLVDMIKQYKDLRHIIEQSRWGKGLDGVDRISHKDCKLQIGTCKTAKEPILKHCPWYHKYKKRFCDYLRVNSSTFMES